MKKQLLLFLFALLPMLAMADASGSCGTNVTYTFDSSTGTLTIQGSGAMTNYYPYSVAPWSSYENDIKTVIIEDGVTSIGYLAFSDCSGLTSVTIPNSVTSIGNQAFQGCSGLTSVTIPNSVTRIGYDAFRDCSGLTSINIPNSVTYIGSNAFEGCSGLTSITIPNSVTSIDYSAFRGCSGLTSIAVAQGNTKYDSRDNCNAIIESASNKLIAGCKTTIIPNSVTSIVDYAFYNCSGLTSVTIPNSVTSIGFAAFKGCSGLTSVTIGNSVTSIGGSAFSDCSSLTSVTIPNSVTSIGLYAFSGCSRLTSVTIGNSVTSIGYYAFSGCSGLTSITIPNSVTSIDYSAFRGCSGLQKVIVPDIAAWCGISFGDYESNPLFYAHHIYSDENTEITDLVIPNSVTSIGERAFYNCSGLTSVTIPNSVTSIGSEAFEGCSGLASITIPNSVTSIGEHAFDRCSGLTSITIPNSVTSIGEYAFERCSGLTSITVAQGNTKYDSRDNCNAIIESASNKLIAGCKTTIIPNSVTSIGDYAFYNCSGLTSVTIPNSVTSIGYSAFRGCSGLTSVISKIETPFAFGAYDFGSISSSCVLTIPIGTRDAYIAAGWTTSVFKGGVFESGNVTIAMKTGSGADRTMIGYSSQYSLDFTGINDVKAYIVIGFTDTKGVLMARVNVVPANTGVVLKSDVAGVEVEVPITTSDVYYANLLKPAVNNVTINPTEGNYTNLMVGKLANDEMGFVTLPSSNTYSNKCYLQVPTAFYNGAASARDGGMEIVFVDDETTDIRSLMYNGSATNDAYYDLQGRKVIPGKKGIYIHNGKKVIVR